MLMVLLPVLKSLSLAVLGFKSFAFEGEVQKGENNRVSMMVGMQQAMLASVLLETLSFIFPLSLGVYALLWIALAGVPIISAISLSFSSMYKTLEAELRKYSAIKLFLPKIIDEYPAIKNIIEHPYSKKIKAALEKLILVSNSPRMTAVFNISHKWLGSVYFYGQAALFSIVAVTVNPVFGLTGLAYFAVSALRSKAYLPAIVSKTLEKFELYVSRFAGLFQANVLLKFSFFFNIAVLGFQEIILPKILAHKLGKDSDFLTVVNDDMTKKPKEIEDVLKSNITLSEFKELFFKDTNVSKNQVDSSSLVDSDTPIEEFKLLFNFKEERKKKAQLFNENTPLKNKREQSASVIWKESKDFYVQIFIHLMNSMNKNLELSMNEIESKYKEKTWKNYILLTFHSIWTSFKLGFGIYVELYVVGKKILTNMKVDKPLATTVGHLAQMPDHYLMNKVSQLNFKVLKESVRKLFIKDDGIINISAHRATIFKSVKFIAKAKEIDPSSGLYNQLSDLYARKDMSSEKLGRDKGDLRSKLQKVENQLKELHEENNENELQILQKSRVDIQEKLRILNLSLDEVDANISEISNTLLVQWRVDLKLPQEATEDDVLLAFMMENFSDVCYKIQTGAGLNNKTVSSIKYFQAMGTQVLAHLNHLIELPDGKGKVFAEDIVRTLALEAGDFCATAMYDMVGNIYAQNRNDILEKAKGEPLSAKEKMQIYLQEERQRIFDKMLYSLNEMPFLPIFIDFRDRHVQSSILSNLTALNLPGKFNVNSDLSNHKGDFLSDMLNKWFSYVIARQFMVIDHGYSPEHIIQELNRQNGNGYAFNIETCMAEWIEKFEDQKVKNFIAEILDPCTVFGEYAMELREKLCALMLYDFGIIEKTNPAEREELPEMDRHLMNAFNQDFGSLGEGIQALFRPGVIESLPISEDMKPFVVGMLDALSSAVEKPSAQAGNGQAEEMQALQSVLNNMDLSAVASLANKAVELAECLEKEAAELRIVGLDGSIDSKELGEFVELSYQHSIAMVADWLGEQGQKDMQLSILQIRQRMQGIGGIVAECVNDAQRLTFIRPNGEININALMRELPRFAQENVNRLHAFSTQSGLMPTPANIARGPDGQVLPVFDMEAGDVSQPPVVEHLVREALRQGVDYVNEYGIPSSPEEIAAAAALLSNGGRQPILHNFRQAPANLGLPPLPEAEQPGVPGAEPAVFTP
jgi:hypothetical protein